MEVMICLIICITVVLCFSIFLIYMMIDSRNTYIPTKSIDELNEKVNQIVDLLHRRK